ncbi:hypothetical protein GCM10009555_018280 [Acrocarpospora macrocephala]|uniref:Uncharacterized protein n=1 Tax=Acrocarpospora macrocephala TaxID=150177 RepID=A0A5M3WME2_9ACTN|nr:hypothetical protein [Acrocarpospora macrocephala]GES07488.1 hypothetical protein Amac_010830 [Acrocarpospora macrocephala]
MSHNYQRGETLRVTFNVKVEDLHDRLPTYVTVHIPGQDADDYLTQLDLAHPELTVERVLPADGDAQEGDLWRDRDGGLWFAQLVETDDASDTPYIELRPESTRKRARGSDYSLQGVNRAHGPLVLAYREQPAEPEQQLTAADLPGMNDARVIIPGVHRDQPIRIVHANRDEGDDIVHVRWQDLRALYPASSVTVPATTAIRLAGGA